MNPAQDHQPGFARRPANFGKLVALAESYQAEALSRDEITRAILFGMPHLTPAETKLLQLYFSFLGRADLLSGRAFVYPSSKLLEATTGWSASTIRRLRQALEHKGLIIRNLNRANRPAHDEAVDLRPLLATVRQAQDDAETVFEAHRSYVAGLAGNDIYQEERSAHPRETDHLIQSQDYQVHSVTKSERPAAKRPVASTNIETAAIQNPVSPKERAQVRFETKRVKSSQSKSGSTIAEKQDRGALARAIELAPELAPYFAGTEIGTASVTALLALAGQAVAGLFPDRNTATHTWNWAVKRHGWRAILGLVSALADPSVRDGYGFLGWISKTPGIDFSTNLQRASAARAAEAEEPTETASNGAGLVGDKSPPVAVVSLDLAPQWASMLDILSKELGAATVNAWLAFLGYHGIEARTLYLTAPGAFIRDRVQMNYTDAIVRAAKAIGLDITHVEITVATS
nr:DnaA N-terminal domain-containing protein [uncultured Dongia sp.]